MKRLVIADIARADLVSIRRYSTRTWGVERTAQYMGALRDTMKGLVRGTMVTRSRDDLLSGVHMVASGRHRIFFEADEGRIRIIRILHDRMDYRRHLGTARETGHEAS